MITRRRFLGHAGAVSLAGLAAALGPSRQVQAADYKALLVVFLQGGYDGNNLLVPLDGAYSEYSKARPGLALPTSRLAALPGTYMDHRLGIPMAAQALLPAFEQKRLAFIANAGPLIEPTTVSAVLNDTAKLPPFLGSHAEQVQYVQGWLGDADPSGWGGRAMDVIDPALKPRQPLVAMANDYTLVMANQTEPSLFASGQTANWGMANLEDRNQPHTQRVEWLSRLQSSNAYEAEYARSLRAAFTDTVDFARGQRVGPEPAGQFANTRIGTDLRYLARHIPYSKAEGARRQVYLVDYGSFDTHALQLSTSANQPGMDLQMMEVAEALMAFDTSMRALGMDGEVTVLVLSEFGRTLDPAGRGAAIGSDHAWGNHWWVMGGAVKGGTVYGQRFPRLVNGGPDDSSQSRRGYWVPQFSTDQVVADALLWMGLTGEQVLHTLPNLANFPTRAVGYL